MTRYHKVLVATDFSDASRNALAQAAGIAARDGAELHVLHVEELHAYAIDGTGFPDESAFEEAVGRASADALGRLRVPSSVKVVKARERDVAAAPAILRYAADQDVDLIVLGTHGRKGLSRWFLGSVAQEVTRGWPGPVLVVGQGASHAAMQPAAPERILVPVDFSGASAAALRAAAQIAAASKARLIVMHSIDMRSLPPYFAAELESAERGQVRKQLDGMLDGLPVEAETVICDGVADERIVETARDMGAQLIVMGTTGLGILDRLLIGSVTERVLRAAPCPVLAYREPPAEMPAVRAAGAR